MVDLKINKGKGTRWYINGEQVFGEATPVYVNYCERCTGMIIVLERKPEVTALTAKYLIFALHALPGPRKFLRRIWKLIQKEFHLMQINYEAASIHVCGGRVDTPQNAYLYELSSRFFVNQTKRAFPEARFFQTCPTPETQYSTLYINEDFVVIHEQY